MNRMIFILILLVITPVVSQSEVPNIGDNTIFTCLESQDELGCFGQISWISNPVTGAVKPGRIITTRRARTLARKFSRRFRVLRNRANRQGDFEASANFELLRQNAVQSRREAKSCRRYESDCLDNDGGGGNNPSVSQACEIAANPAGVTTAQLSQRNATARIVNGAVCSMAQNSPALLILLSSIAHCTGSLVKPNVVITAAHCVEGIDCRELSVQNYGGAARNVSNCVMHPNYGGNSDNHDVAVLTLDSDLTATNIVEIQTSNNIQPGERVAFAGFGRNEANDLNLRATFNTVLENSGEQLVTLYTQGDINEGTTCNGDSGGPLYVFRENQWVLIGTTASGSANNCALPGNENSDRAVWANITSASNLAFIANNTEGVID